MPVALVTGGAGFIGSHVVGALLARGYQVRILDNLSTGRTQNLPDQGSGAQFIAGDIRDPAAVQGAVRGADVLFHLAAQISVAASILDPGECFDINVTGTNLVLQYAAKAGVRRAVLSSSAAVYGEQALLPVGEGASPSPLSPYAASKLMDEVLAGLYSRTYDLPVTCLRYFNVYGPRQDPASPYAAAIPIFIRRLLAGTPPTVFGDGGQTRDFIYVADVARANVLAGESSLEGGSVLNVCSGKETSIQDLLTVLRSLIPGQQGIREEPARAGEIYRSCGDPSRAEGMLGFAAAVPLEQGLRETIDWMAQ